MLGALIIVLPFSYLAVISSNSSFIKLSTAYYIKGRYLYLVSTEFRIINSTAMFVALAAVIIVQLSNQILVPPTMSTCIKGK